MKDIKFEKRGDRYLIRATLEGGQKVERAFPRQAIEAIMQAKGLTEQGACEYLAVHQWAGLENQPPPEAPKPTPPPKPVVASPPPPPPKPMPMSHPPPPPVPVRGPKDILEEILGDTEEESPEEEEPAEEELWDDYDWLMEQARIHGYFSRPGIQSRRKEDLQKWLRKKLNKS